MSGLDSIGVKVEGGARGTGNALPLLHEVRHALARLLQDGQETAIDLLGIPMTPEDLAQLDSLLGSGEVEAKLTALGPSRILETAFPGVWLVEHYNAEEAIMARFLEVTFLPAILRSDPDDVRDGLVRLDSLLSDASA